MHQCAGRCTRDIHAHAPVLPRLTLRTVNERTRSAAGMTRAASVGEIAVLGPLPLYAARPYAALPRGFAAIEYVPHRSAVRWLWHRSHALPDEWELRRFSLPLPQGMRRLGRVLHPLVRARLSHQLGQARAVVLTSPFQEPLIGLFPDVPLLYHVFDEYASYGWTEELIGAREARIMERGAHVVVVSEALGRLYREKHNLPSSRITVIPNGYDPSTPSSLPADIARINRPRIGTLGNVNVRLRLDWVLEILEALPWATWTFVGGVVDDGPAASKAALARLREHPRCAFVGAKQYAELPAYAAAFDVAVFPFSNHILNRASSPTRFFSQVAFGQPILATRECEQIAALPSLVQFCDSAADFVEALTILRVSGFRDGREDARLEFARTSTWTARARRLAETLGAVTASTPAPASRERRPG